MELMRAFLFAQSYGRHLQQTAFDRAMKISVWLDSIDQHDGIGPGCVAVLVNAEFARSAKLDHLHAAADRHAHRFFGDPIVGQNFQLPLSRPTTVATHRGHNEYICSESLEFFAYRSDNNIVVRNPSAAGSHCHGHAAPNAL